MWFYDEESVKKLVKVIFMTILSLHFNLNFKYMKNYILLGLVSSMLIAPSLFADTATGTTATGTDCSTASWVKANMVTAQQVFLTEMTRLITEKWVAYTAALSLSGSLKTDAIKAANVKFRAGVKAAIQTRELAKKNNKSLFLSCKKHEDKQEAKHQIKELRKTIKEIKKTYRSNHKNK